METVSRQDWQEDLARLGAREGFYEKLGEQHSALFLRKGATLIVTFENLDDVFAKAEDRMPWGYDFVTRQGWSMLGMMAHGWTWYRDDAVLDFFDRLRDEGFFRRFEKVVFYGASMGGYAAAAFSAAAPGATVICLSPQATLSREIAPWETRYRKAWRRDFSGRYGYAPESAAQAAAVHLFYDPAAPLDAMHAALFEGPKVRKYRCRYFGHRIASLWLQMGVLKPVVLDCVSGTLTPQRFYGYLRARRENNRYHREMLARLEKSGRPERVRDFCKAVLARRRGPAFRRALRRAERVLATKKSG